MDDGATTPEYGSERLPAPVRCPLCGYDLTGIGLDRCPECGGDTTGAEGGSLALRHAVRSYVRTVRRGVMLLELSYAVIPILIVLYVWAPSLSHMVDHASWVLTLLGWWWVGTADVRDSEERRWSARRSLRLATVIVAGYALVVAGVDFFGRATGAAWHGAADGLLAIGAMLGFGVQVVFGLKHQIVLARRLAAPSLERWSVHLYKANLATLVLVLLSGVFVGLTMVLTRVGELSAPFWCGSCLLLPATAAFMLYVFIALVVLQEGFRRRLRALERWMESRESPADGDADAG